MVAGKYQARFMFIVCSTAILIITIIFLKGEGLHVSLLKQDIIHRYKQSHSDSIELVSLPYDCPGCVIPCKTIHVNISKDCQGFHCLCHKKSPVLTFSTKSLGTEIKGDFMLNAEKITLKDKRITDLKDLPDMQNTEITVLNKNNKIEVGEKVNILIQIVNGYGKKLHRGGDQIRTWMVEKKNPAHRIAGRVKDFNNGTYLLTLNSFWKGTNNIYIAFPYFREESATFFRWYRQYGTIVYYYGEFRGKVNQLTLCNIYPTVPGYKDICNLTVYNDGEPWYCGKPPSDQLNCEDFVRSHDYRMINIGVTEAEQTCFRRSCLYKGRKLKPVQVSVVGNNPDRNHLPNCEILNSTSTWNLIEPTGYYTGNKYIQTKCQESGSIHDIKHCLKNTTFILSGDSTSLQWTRHLQQISNCDVKQKNFTSGKWCDELTCVNEEWNFTVNFIPHNMPFSNIENKLHEKHAVTKSFSTMLNNIPSNGRFVFVFHLYLHISRQHYHAFRDKILRMKPALRRALDRNKDLVVAIKGPHTTACHGWVPNTNDFFGRHYIDILHLELQEFSHRIWYLDYWDMTVANENTEIHVDLRTTKNMLQMLFNYICPLS